MDDGLRELVSGLEAAVQADSVERVTALIKQQLEDLLGRSALQLPGRFRIQRQDGYARRLLYQDPAQRFTAVVMTWGPGQGTPVHDHGGLWCVEGVVDGEMTVTQFDVTAEGDAFRVTPIGRPMTAGVGTAGRLIPPTDFHVLANARPTDSSITLHVYGGSLEGCRVFLPRSDGRFDQAIRPLTYHD
ncbi:MAG: hypothetical protein ACT4QD_20445 [Acidobacteriota bacterium]